MHETPNEDEARMLSIRTLELALTCFITFDVDSYNLPHILSSKEALAIATHCSIVISDRCPVETDKLPAHIAALLRRFRRLSHLMEPFLRKQILADPDGIHITVRELWTVYESGTPWVALEAPNQHWLTTQTSSRGELSPMEVQFNILHGNLLINGSPLTRLPHKYENHSSYRRLFGEVRI